MWPFPSKKNEFVALVISPDAIACSWIQQKQTRCLLAAYIRTELHAFECLQGSLFNITRITNIIHHFLSSYRLHDASISIAVTGKHIVESVVDLPHATPQPHDFPFVSLRSMVWDFIYLYPQDDAHYAFYVCAITRQHLMQYKLLAIKADLNVTTLTTTRVALLQLYKQQWGSAFRHTQLLRDLQKHNNDLYALFSIDALHRQLIIRPSLALNVAIEKNYLTPSLGLFHIEKRLYHEIN